MAVSEQDRTTAEEAVRGNWLAARMYDRMLAKGERAGMEARRAALVSQARGAVLEIGAGTGLNLAHYPDGLDRLVLCEPEKHMVGRIERRVAQLGRTAQVVQARAEALPFEDASFDTVVATLVLCTIADPEAALDEIRRVLRPGGTLLFVEHVRAEEEGLARWQDRLRRPWGVIGSGCQCNRRTVERLRDRGYEVSVTERGEWARMPRLVRPIVAGRATPGGAAAATGA